MKLLFLKIPYVIAMKAYTVSMHLCNCGFGIIYTLTASKISLEI